MLRTSASTTEILTGVDLVRIDAARHLTPAKRSSLGQFLTPAPLARLMASMIESNSEEIRILDPGAGVGSLFTAAVQELLSRPRPPKSITVTAYELDPFLATRAAEAVRACAAMCQQANTNFAGEVIVDDFVACAEALILPTLESPPPREFDCVIMNPPYSKITADSPTRRALRRMGLETGNSYSAFVYLAVRLLRSDGELIAITPRSFANGPYFAPFRKWLLSSIALDRIHVFESREDAFREDEVLQENVILHGHRSSDSSSVVRTTSSRDPGDSVCLVNDVPSSTVSKPNDPHAFIHILPDGLSERIAELAGLLPCRFEDLGVSVSTGRVVDFRAQKHLSHEVNDADSVPLIYPQDFCSGTVQWPTPRRKKALAINRNQETEALLIPNDTYVLIKRFSSKEEPRRLTAAVIHPEDIPAAKVGIENHLNYFHAAGRGLPRNLAQGLATYLNSTFADMYFRQFSGHTQVNATDLRNMRYPDRDTLTRLGNQSPILTSQYEIDQRVAEEILSVETNKFDPVKAQRKIQQGLEIIKALGLPSAQQNDRSSLTLLSLLNLRPGTAWAKAQAPLMGITPMMTFFAEEYGKQYAPNTRETVRRQTVHQFVDAGIAVPNPDDPDRAINSPYAVYQIEQSALELVRTYGRPAWEQSLTAYLASRDTLVQKYAQARQLRRIPVLVSKGQIVTLSPGGQNILIERIVHEFADRFTPGGRVVYVGDTGEKFAHFDSEYLASLGVQVDPHGKMPDVIIHHVEQNWLVLVEAVTSHGPVDPKRQGELIRLFSGAKAGLVFVTAFLDRRGLASFLDSISWETEVWVAESPDHLIHFNGERFLGPY